MFYFHEQIISWLILIGAIVYINVLPPVSKTPIKKSFIYFPFRIDDWTDKEKIVSDEIISFLHPDDILQREYKDKDGEKLDLYLAYFEYLKVQKGPHAPQWCWVGAGWVFKDLGTEKLQLNSGKNTCVWVKKILAQGNDETKLLLYCYKINDKYTVDYSQFRLFAAIDSIFKRKNSAFTLQLSAQVDKENLEQKEKLMKTFLVKALSVLEEKFLP